MTTITFAKIIGTIEMFAAAVTAGISPISAILAAVEAGRAIVTEDDGTRIRDLAELRTRLEASAAAQARTSHSVTMRLVARNDTPPQDGQADQAGDTPPQDGQADQAGDTPPQDRQADQAGDQ